MGWILNDIFSIYLYSKDIFGFLGTTDQGLSQDLETGCRKLGIVKLLDVFLGRPQYTQVTTITAYIYLMK